MPHPTDDRKFRLPRDVRPTAYDAALSLDPDARSFGGSARIELVLDAPRDELVLHAAGLDVREVRLRAGGGPTAPVEIRPAAASETVVLRFGSPVPRGPAALDLRARSAAGSVRRRTSGSSPRARGT